LLILHLEISKYSKYLKFDAVATKYNMYVQLKNNKKLNIYLSSFCMAFDNKK